MFISIISMHAQKEVDNYEIQVDGLGCPFCAYGLEKKFKEFKGIKNVAIKIETGDFSFTYPSTTPLLLETVINQVKKAGYTPITAKITRANGQVEEINKATSSTKNNKNTVTAVFRVEGVCEMCKARIEAASLQSDGVQNAIWNKDTKKVTIHYDEHKISKEIIAQKIADEGHDNEYIKALNTTYNNLPMCCTYRDQNTKNH